VKSEKAAVSFIKKAFRPFFEKREGKWRVLHPHSSGKDVKLAKSAAHLHQEQKMLDSGHNSTIDLMGGTRCLRCFAIPVSRPVDLFWDHTFYPVRFHARIAAAAPVVYRAITGCAFIHYWLWLPDIPNLAFQPLA